MPTDGEVREYWLNVEEISCAPDGYNTKCLTYNGTIPGPTLFVSGHGLFLPFSSASTESGLSVALTTKLRPGQLG